MYLYLVYQTLNILIISVVENYVKKTRNSFPIAVLLTTLIYNPFNNYSFFGFDLQL